jgi:hypothetical protein
MVATEYDKYMTGDCPCAKRRKKENVLLLTSIILEFAGMSQIRDFAASRINSIPRIGFRLSFVALLHL